MRKWRKSTWALAVWSALMVLWLVSYANSDECAEKATRAAQSGCEAGEGIGVFLILVIAALGFIVLSLIWLMTRPRT